MTHNLVNGVIEVRASDVTVSGFTINGSWIGIWVTDYLEPYPSRCKIVDNNIVNNSRWGIKMDGKNHFVSGNNITRNGDGGIYVSSKNSVVSGNSIVENEELGVVLNSDYVTLCGNSITGNGFDVNASSDYRGGLMLRWDGGYCVYGNNISDNQGYGVAFATQCSDAIIYENDIVRNLVGVELQNFALTENSAIGQNNLVYRNNLVDNTQQVIIMTQFGRGVDVVSWDNETEGNYWSDYSGVDGAGIGATPYVVGINNLDNYPLVNSVEITLTPPPESQMQPNQFAITIALAIIVLPIAVGVALLVRLCRKID
jgi:parallel beta-helix repeat protein